MANKFNIHDWQANQRQRRLAEQEKFTPVSGDEKLRKNVNAIADIYSYGEILDALESFYTKNDEQQSAEIARKHAKEFRNFLDTMDKYEKRYGEDEYDALTPTSDNPDPGGYGAELDEHHAGDYKPGFLKQSVSTFLDKLKKKKETDYNKVEKIIEKYFSAKKQNEASATGVGTSFKAGSGEGYMTPKAFKKKNKK